jgi:hypothetical protein
MLCVAAGPRVPACTKAPGPHAKAFAACPVALPSRGPLPPRAQAPEAAPTASGMKLYHASDMSPAQLQEFTARPRVDFTSILGTVGGGLMGVFCLAGPHVHMSVNPPCWAAVLELGQEERQLRRL